MKKKVMIVLTFAALLFGHLSAGPNSAGAEKSNPRYLIVTSDTILSGMAKVLLPAGRYRVESILPPGQCPGHYDVKLSDIEMIHKADLIILFRGMPFMEKPNAGGRARLVVDNDTRNWMAPDSYVFGLNRLAGELIIRFPEDRKEILKRKETNIRLVRDEAQKLRKQMVQAGLPGRAVLASTLQKEPLEWMGLHIVGEYGRPESLSTRDVVHLLRIGRDQDVVAVVDNLQSGPETGKSIAKTLGRPHIVLNNFPTERGYLTTLKENVYAVLAVAKK